MDVESVFAQGGLMTKHPDEPSVQIEVIPAAPEQEAVLGNLLDLSIHDFSELRDFHPGPLPFQKYSQSYQRLSRLRSIGESTCGA